MMWAALLVCWLPLVVGTLPISPGWSRLGGASTGEEPALWTRVSGQSWRWLGLRGGAGSSESKTVVCLVAAANDGYVRRGSGREYDDYEEGPRKPRYMPQPKGQAQAGGGATLLSLFQNQKQLGALLVGIGLVLTLMGMALFFEGTLLRLGNICTILGIPLLVGPDRVRGFFLKESRIQATIITSLGILLVFWGRPRLGILCEVFGLLNLFGNMFPLLFALAKRMPIIGDVLSAFDKESTSKRRREAVF